MMHIFLHALGASTASGLTYLENVLPELAERQHLRTTVAASPRVRSLFNDLKGIVWADLPDLSRTVQRSWFEQRGLPALLNKLHADVLISAGNFALRNSPVPQVLLSGNSLYTSRDFYRDLLARHEYRLWLDTRVRAVFAKKSVHWADCTVAPTQAFADELRRWTGRPVAPIHHGFDQTVFFGNLDALPNSIQQRLDSAKDALKLLYVSHYNYFRNFETLFRALSLIKQKLDGKAIRLFVTCKLQDGENPGPYKTKAARLLVKQLGIENEVVEMGTVAYRQLHHLYAACDLYVTPSYAETFAHPVVEARACGLPIVASDLPVHREVCGSSALYFSRFSPLELAERVLQQAAISGCKRKVRSAVPFSWRDHVDQVLGIAQVLIRPAIADAA